MADINAKRQLHLNLNAKFLKIQIEMRKLSETEILSIIDQRIDKDQKIVKDQRIQK